MSNVKEQQHNMQVVRGQVCKLLGLSVQAYHEYHSDNGTLWLMEHLQHHYDVVDDVLQTSIYAKWWALNAYHRDVAWLHEHSAYPKHILEQQRMLNDWLYYHSARRLVDINNKHGILLYNGYANINWRAE